MALPNWYIDWIPRVSDIVSFVFPFKWEDKARYQEWLAGKWINEDEYLKEAQDVWTFVHQQLENYLNKEKQDIDNKLYKLHKKEIENWIKFIKKIKKKYKKKDWWEYVAEPVLLDNKKRYQWSSDLVFINDKKKEVVIIDWKSFGIAKKRWNLPNNYKKPYDKIKKGRLQFSLYWYTFIQQWYKINELILVYLREENYYAYSLEQIDIKELDTILFNYYKNMTTKENKNIEINFDWFDVEILEPTKQYGNIKVRVDWSKLDNWKTFKENLDNAVKVVNYLKNKLQ